MSGSPVGAWAARVVAGTAAAALAAVAGAERADALAWRPAESIPIERGSVTGGPDVASGPGRQVAAAWIERVGNRERMMVSTRSGFRARWRPAQNVSFSVERMSDPSVAYGRDGRLVIGWSELDGSDSQARTVERKRGELSYRGAQPLELPLGQDDETTITTSNAGWVAASWSEPESNTAMVAVKEPGRPWRQPTDLGTSPEPPNIGFQSNGTIHASWIGDDCTVRSARYVPAQAQWGQPDVVATNVCRAVPANPRPPGLELLGRHGLSVGSSGHALIWWTSEIDDVDSLTLVPRPPGGPWGAPAARSAERMRGSVKAGIDRAGRAVLVWEEVPSLVVTEATVGAEVTWGSTRSIFPEPRRRGRAGSGDDRATEVGDFGVRVTPSGAAAVFWDIEWTLRDAVAVAMRSARGRWDRVRRLGIQENVDVGGIAAVVDGPRSVTAAWRPGRQGGAPTRSLGAIEVARLAPTSARCRGVPATIVGTGRRDLLFGSSAPDVIVALGGADRVLASYGRDRVCGGSGKDRLDGGGHRDVIFGQGGADVLLGGRANDVLNGGPGRDVARGGDGRDRCTSARPIAC